MKTIKLIPIFLVFCHISSAQLSESISGSYFLQRNNKKEISFFKLIDNYNEISIKSDFFNEILDISKDDEFRFLKRGNEKSGKYFEEYKQYYKGILVKDGVFILHWDDGGLESANGNYIRIPEFDVKPSITDKEAVQKWCEYLKIPENVINGYTSELMVIDLNESNEIEVQSKIVLVYKILLNSKQESSQLIGYIDAHTGNICKTSPTTLSFSQNITDPEVTINSINSPIYASLSQPLLLPSPSYSTFHTRYSNTKSNVITDYKNNYYYLEDWTRGQGIETLDLQNLSISYMNEAESITNDDTDWDIYDFEDEFGNAALDVYWGLQAIYDYYLYEHLRSGWDSTGQKINAYVHTVTGEGADCAFYSPTYEVLGFGDGFIKFKPVVAIDVVAHEYAHGLNHHTSGFGDSGISLSFNEALSDIWAAIIEDYISPSDPNWQIGDKVMNNGYDCLRNLENPNDSSAYRKMADTYGSVRYYSDSNEYFRSGVMSHFFFLLCNGGSGENELGNPFNVYNIDIEDAADLVYFAQAEHYLNGTTTYPLMRTNMLAASDILFGSSSLESMQVANAWYAVGVGSEPFQMSITGNSTVCKYGTKFQIENLPSGCTVAWSCDSRMHLSSSTGASIVVFADQSGTGGWVKATVSSSYSSVEVEYNDITINASTPSISGSAIICSSGTTFTLSASCAYDSIKWTKDSYLNITSGQATLSCTFAASGNGASKVYATIYVNGSSTTYSKDVWAGKPTFSSISGPSPSYIDEGCTGQPYTFWAYPARDALSQSSYQWMVEPSYYDWYFQYQYYDWVTIVFNDPYEYYQVIARATNACGATNWVYKNVSITDCYRYSMYPNPASEYVTITLTVDESVKKEEVPSNILVRITDNSGITYYSGTKGGDSFTLPVSNLKDGNYIVSIIYDGKIENLPLIIKR